MADDAEEPGFLSRWSKRKVQVRQGQVLEAASPAAACGPPESKPEPEAVAVITPAAAKPQADMEPLPTLADVATLTRESDYSRFMVSSVQPEVKNAALAKLFTDPHFNVMDGLDVYIDDYGKPDPLPASMLRQMLQAQVLGLFDDEKEQDPALVQSTPVQPEPTVDENTDLQLQPDDDAGRPGPEPGAGEDAGRAH